MTSDVTLICAHLWNFRKKERDLLPNTMCKLFICGIIYLNLMHLSVSASFWCQNLGSQSLAIPWIWVLWTALQKCTSFQCQTSTKFCKTAVAFYIFDVWFQLWVPALASRLGVAGIAVFNIAWWSILQQQGSSLNDTVCSVPTICTVHRAIARTRLKILVWLVDALFQVKATSE